MLSPVHCNYLHRFRRTVVSPSSGSRTPTPIGLLYSENEDTTLLRYIGYYTKKYWPIRPVYLMLKQAV